MSDKEKIKWKGRTGGGNLGQRLLITLLRVVPIRLIYCVSAATVPFYIIFAYSRYRAIYRYFREQWRLSPRGAFCRAYRNHVLFSQIVVDRFAVFAGKKDIFDTEIEGYDIFDELNRHSKGFVMVSSHIGNYEITGYVLKPDKKRINSLVFASETALVAQNRFAIMGDNNINIVPVGRRYVAHIHRKPCSARWADRIGSSRPYQRLRQAHKVSAATRRGSLSCGNIYSGGNIRSGGRSGIYAQGIAHKISHPDTSARNRLPRRRYVAIEESASFATCGSLRYGDGKSIGTIPRAVVQFLRFLAMRFWRKKNNDNQVICSLRQRSTKSHISSGLSGKNQCIVGSPLNHESCFLA